MEETATDSTFSTAKEIPEIQNLGYRPLRYLLEQYSFV